MSTLRVLVTVNEGVAAVYADAGVEVEVVDYDNDPDAVIPVGFVHLLRDDGTLRELTPAPTILRGKPCAGYFSRGRY